MSKKITCLCLLPLIPALAEQPKFEIADVHPSTTLRAYVQSFGGVVHEGRYINREATMLALIKAAYGVSDDISGGPGWVSYDLFDVIARVPEGTTPATANLMLQSLLSERFGLVVRRDTRPVPRYILTVEKSGSKLKSGDDPAVTTPCGFDIIPTLSTLHNCAFQPIIRIHRFHKVGEGVATSDI